ncbi:MAG: 3-deoxy-manno-octulosonate cytidylyltransferase [Magnetococcales bacterium]|nr:3-deoxy-manno-octulosonate cytidylyltransferase [Magnetococcales bacterium]MBF0419220.1 3-deoxy-manno-octulosonate cytidylyltransferase [Magnetococcales bacterium]
MTPRIVAIIPVRFASQRLPGKPLLPIAGKPMIQHVYERALLARLDDVVVATDDPRIYDTVQNFGGRVVMTDQNHPSGTDRVAEAAAGLTADVVVNIQGDEPLLDANAVNAAIAPFLDDSTLVMSTLAHEITHDEDIRDPNAVKVVCDTRGFALYFSRSPIPYFRHKNQGFAKVYRHIGLYAFRKDFLTTFAALPPTDLEKCEGLEQLRALEHGYRIRVIPTDHAAIGVDTMEDYKKVCHLLENGEP